MPTTTGTLTKVLPKDTGYFSLKIGDVWYGGGKTRPDAVEGDTVEVTYTTKDKNGTTYYNASEVRVVNRAATVARSAKEAAATAPHAVAEKDSYWKNKEERDLVNDMKRELGASRNTAVEIVNFAIEKGYLPSLDKAKVADKFDLYISIIEGTAARLMDGGGRSKQKTMTSQAADAHEQDQNVSDDED